MFKQSVIFFLLILFFHANVLFSQEMITSIQAEQPANSTSSMIDRTQDSLIINHVLLTAKELQILVVGKSFSVYGDYLNELFKNGKWYKIEAKHDNQLVIKRKRQHNEWLFYSFFAMFFFIGLINILYSSYLNKLIRSYINEGFIFFQAREQLTQFPVASLLMNLFFFLTTSFFIFFWFTTKGIVLPVEDWKLLIFIFLVLVSVYLFKYIFLHSLGWILNQRELFGNYAFVIFLNNKIIGLILLFFTFLIAFAKSVAANDVADFAIGVLVIVFLFRFFKGFSLFSKHSKLTLFSFTLAVLSLEILPTAVLIKFISVKFIAMSSGS